MANRRDLREQRSDSSSSKRRRNLPSIVTEDAIQSEVDRLNRHLGAIRRELALPYVTEGPTHQILLSGVIRAGVSALVYLRESQGIVYNQLVTAAVRYSRDMLQDGEATYRIPAAMRGRRFFEWWAGPSLVALHEQITQRLKVAWGREPEPALIGIRTFPGRTRRYGDRQRAGTQRYHAMLKWRAETVCEVAREMLERSDAAEKPAGAIDVSLARRWVAKHTAPSAISLLVIANLTGLTVRSVKRVLNEARKRLKSPLPPAVEGEPG